MTALIATIHNRRRALTDDGGIGRGVAWQGGAEDLVDAGAFPGGKVGGGGVVC